MHRTIYNILLPQRADTSFPSLPLKECTGVRYVIITKFSRMDSLPNFSLSVRRFCPNLKSPLS